MNKTLGRNSEVLMEIIRIVNISTSSFPFNAVADADRRAEIAFMGITRQQYVQHVQEESTEL